MVDIPTVTDDGNFFVDNRPLTKYDLGYYVKGHSLKEVKAYTDGIADTCGSFHEVMQKADNNELTLDEFKRELRDVLIDRHNLLEVMFSYIRKCEKERGVQPKP